MQRTTRLNSSRTLLFTIGALLLATVMSMAIWTAPAEAASPSSSPATDCTLTVQSSYDPTYAIIKSDGHMYRSNASHETFYDNWGTDWQELATAVAQTTTLYIDADVTNLTKVTAPRQNGSSITYDSIDFNGGNTTTGCPNLQKIVFLTDSSGKNACNTLLANYMFANQKNLTTVENFDKTQLLTIPGECFYNCSLLSSIKLPSTASSIGEAAFYNCDGLTSITIPSSVKTIGTTLWYDGVFEGCDNLKKIILQSTTRVNLARTSELDDTPTALKIYVPNTLLSTYKSSESSNNWATYKSQIHAFLETATVSNKVYTGKAIKPTPKVTWCGTKLAASNYTMTYSNNKNVGKAKIIVKGKGSYAAKTTRTFKIVPKASTIKKVSALTKGFKATWKKIAVQNGGYQIQYSTNSKFKSGNKTVTVKKAKTISKKITKLKAKKKYYVRVRTFKKVNGVTYYGAWSAKRAIKTK